jgi:hypothetical protein
MCCLWLSKIDARESDVLALVDRAPAPDFHCPVTASNHMMVAEKGSFEVGFMIRFPGVRYAARVLWYTVTKIETLGMKR